MDPTKSFRIVRKFSNSPKSFQGIKLPDGCS
jgi:hypothetical protein